MWRLRVWLLRPFQNEPNVFAASHPCLGAGGPVYDVTAALLIAHPEPVPRSSPRTTTATTPRTRLRGRGPALAADRRERHGLGARTNQSGSDSKTSPPPLSATLLATASGYPAWAVDGFPADSVLYALDTLHVNPDLLVSGINNGQNIGPLITLSGTVGAARVGGRAEIPAVGVSQGLGSPPDFPHGAVALIAWVDDFLLGRVGTEVQSVTNINIPTCTAGSIRGTAVLPTARLQRASVTRRTACRP